MSIRRGQIGVIIIHYANLANIRAAVASVLASKNAEKLHVVIVDNAAQEPAEALRDTYTDDRVTILRLSKNRGFSGANNAGIRWALNNLSGVAVVLLNDDATVAPDALPILLESLQNNARLGAVTPKIYFTAGHEFHAGYSKDELGKVLWYAGGIIDWREVVGSHRGVDEVDRGQYDTLIDTPFATGCCVALNAETLQSIGALDDKYFLYYEDSDLSLRMRRAGWKVQYQPKAVAWHQNAGSSGSGSKLHVYYQTRNRLLFAWRYAPWRAKLFLAKQAVLQLRGADPIIKRAILDAVQQRYGIQPDLHTH